MSDSNPDQAPTTTEEPDPVMVVMRFDTAQFDELGAILSNYVVLTRSHPGCRNVDFVTSATTEGRFLVVQKWDSDEAQRRHFDSSEMIDMAQACTGLLTRPPEIDLYTGISMHDLL